METCQLLLLSFLGGVFLVSQEIKADPENESLARHYKKTRDVMNKQLAHQSDLLNSCVHLLLNLAEGLYIHRLFYYVREIKQRDILCACFSLLRMTLCMI